MFTFTNALNISNYLRFCIVFYILVIMKKSFNTIVIISKKTLYYILSKYELYGFCYYILVFVFLESSYCRTKNRINAEKELPNTTADKWTGNDQA